MSENKDILTPEMQKIVLERIAIVIIGLVYSRISEEVTKVPRWRIDCRDEQMILIINFDWWLPFKQITATLIKAMVKMVLQGSFIEVEKSAEGSDHDSWIFLKNKQRITICRYESNGRYSDNSVVVVFSN